MSVIDNGVNVQALLDAREALADAPDAAKFTWRASSRWENGVHSTTSIQNFFGLGEEQSHKTEAVFDADASRQEIEALVAQSQKRSAVFDALTNPTEVTVAVA